MKDEEKINPWESWWRQQLSRRLTDDQVGGLDIRDTGAVLVLFSSSCYTRL